MMGAPDCSGRRRLQGHAGAAWHGVPCRAFPYVACAKGPRGQTGQLSAIAETACSIDADLDRGAPAVPRFPIVTLET
mgnify:CR=1 FL=1